MLRVLLVAAVAVALVACAGCPRAPQPEQPSTAPKATKTAPSPSQLTVFAASSLTEAFDTFAEGFTKAHPSTKVSTNYAGTQELRTQVEQGARPDVFASASKEHMDALVKAGLVKDAVVFARSKLCVVAAKEPGKVKSLKDLAQPGVRVVVAVETCPAGKYTRQCWDKMAASKAFGPGYVAAVKASVKSEETNVKLVLAKVELGEADAGFVYRSDIGSAKVAAIALPAEVAVEATYEVGIGAETKNPGGAQEFVTALLGPEGRKALQAHGLEPASPPE